MDEREDVTMIAAQQFAQMCAARGMTFIPFHFTHRTRRLERLGNLIIQFDTVCDNHKRPVAFHLAQNFLSEEYHCEAFPASLCLPKNATPPITQFPCGEHGGDGVVHAENLVILTDDLHESGLVFREHREVFKNIQEPYLVARAANQHFQ